MNAKQRRKRLRWMRRRGIITPEWRSVSQDIPKHIAAIKAAMEKLLDGGSNGADLYTVRQ